ncbi:MAG TPA: hypothetical protein VIM30_05710 [Candidatus Limnocylindrales bacterium]
MTTSKTIQEDRVAGLSLRVLLAIGFVVGLWLGIRSSTAPLFGVVPFFIAYAGVGTFLAVRRPRNVIGWILVGLGWFFVLVVAPTGVPFELLQTGSAGAWEEAQVWLGAWIGSAGFALFFLLTVVFPSGLLPTGQWGRLVRLALAFDAVLIVLAAFEPTVGGPGSTDIPNPLALFPEAPIWAVSHGGQLIFPTIAVMLVGLISMLIRYRRSRGLERQQLRWVVSALAFVAVGILFGLVTLTIVGPTTDEAWIPALVAYPTVPLAIGIAVMRYRLYEIDRIVSRTLSYSSLTAALAVVYVAAFVALQAVLAPFTSSGGPLAVAASTLAVFAIFQPLRRRLQSTMDRRFNRSRYDAQRTVAAFAGQLRDEVDIERLGGEIQTVIGRTLAPASVSVWLRPSGRAADR